MWSAIKNDLFEFVSTVQSDTKETLAKVIETRKGADEDSPDAQKKKKNHEKERLERNEKMIQELTQSYSTYAEDVDPKSQSSFDKFKSSFSLSSHSSDIARILEWETEVSKYYCDLVPDVITAELFWARYYFKLDVLKSKSLLGNNLDDEEDEEEELTWDDDAGGAAVGTETNEKLEEVTTPLAEVPPVPLNQSTDQALTTSKPSQSLENQIPSLTPLSLPSLPPSDKIPSPDTAIEQQPIDSPQPSASMAMLLSSLQKENSYLTHRVTDLENEVQRLKDELKYYHTHYPATLSFPNSESSVSSIDEDHSYQKKPLSPIESSYEKIGESGGESDGLVVLSNEINSDSDFISKSKGQQRKKSSSTTTSKTTRLATIASTEENEPNTIKKSSTTTAGQVKEKSSPAKAAVENRQEDRGHKHGDDEEDEEEVGWDDSGW